MIKEVKHKGCPMVIPEGSAFAYETPPEMLKSHQLMGVFGKRGSGKSLSCCNLIKQMGYTRSFIISPTASSNSELMKLLPIVDKSDIYTDENDVGCLKDIENKLDLMRDEMAEYKSNMKKYKDFINIVNNPSQSVPDDMLMLFYHNGTFNQPEWRYGLDSNGDPKPPHCCLLCDDLQMSAIMTSRKTAQFCLRHRHHGSSEDNTPSIGISIFFLQQTYRSSNGGTPKWMRSQFTSAIFFSTANELEKKQIALELSGEVKTQTFLEMLEWATKEPYGFLLWDGHKKSIHPSCFRKGFNTFLLPSDKDTEL